MTDSHQDYIGINNAILAINNEKNVDFVIHTGDVCASNFYDLPYNSKQIPYAICIGNHDSHLGSYNWSIKTTQENYYKKFFEPNLSTSNITIEKNTTYWFKKLKDCTVIGIDYTTRGDSFYKQWYWLENILSECLADKTPVFIGSHEIIHSLNPIKSSDFTCSYYANSWKKSTIKEGFFGVFPMCYKSYEIVCKYADLGLQVLCWVFGHEHPDMLFKSNNKNTFPMICCGSTLHDSWNNVFRSGVSGDWQNDAVINKYEWRKNDNYMLISRIGCKKATEGDLRDFIAFDYEKHEYISAEARG